MRIICPNPNCGYEGEAKKVPRGSCLIALLLFIFGILPGLLYVFLKSGYRYCCPRCNFQMASDA